MTSWPANANGGDPRIAAVFLRTNPSAQPDGNFTAILCARSISNISQALSIKTFSIFAA